jgi:nitroimidazol reductase NimA-like FMN-containing flavoprotein (pyridoxamine 5'-phosphate oxidase superfamily)
MKGNYVMKKYHIRRQEKSMEKEEIFSIIKEKTHMTVSMCCNEEPYLVTVNYAFDRHINSFYFHCANEGKKLDFLRKNSKVYGQILDDRGYITGECNYNYATVQFTGEAGFTDNEEEKYSALDLMIEKLESEPEKVKKKMLSRNLSGVTIIKVKVEHFSGKKYVSQR